MRLSNTALKAFKVDDNEIVDDSDGKTNKMVMIFSYISKNNKFRKLIHISNIRAIRKPIFLTLNAKKTYNHLKQAFIKASIL